MYASELVTGVTKGVALGVRIDLGRHDREHRDRHTLSGVKSTITHLVLPPSVPFGGPHLGKASQHLIVPDLYGIAFKHHVQPFIPVIGASRQQDVWVATQVPELLFSVTGAEVESPVMPHGNEGRGMRATVGPHRRQPEEFGGLKDVARLLPRRGCGFGIAVARVQRRSGFVHRNRSCSVLWRRKGSSQRSRTQPRLLYDTLSFSRRHCWNWQALSWYSQTLNQWLTSLLLSKQLPVPLGDDGDLAVNDLNSGLIVNRVRWHWPLGGPSFGVGHGIVRTL